MKNMNSTQTSFIVSGLKDPIRQRILEIISSKFEERRYLPRELYEENIFCPEDILFFLEKEGFNLTYSKLSYHLKDMRERKILLLYTEGKRRFYGINKDSLELIIRWIESLKAGISK